MVSYRSKFEISATLRSPLEDYSSAHGRTDGLYNFTRILTYSALQYSGVSVAGDDDKCPMKRNTCQNEILTSNQA